MSNYMTLEEILGIGNYRNFRTQEKIVPECNNDSVYFGKKEPQYISPQEREALENIPDEAIIAIKKFDSNNPRNTTQSYGELEVVINVPAPNNESLLYALNEGTAYKIVDKVIYIWYKHHKGFNGSGFYRLKRFHYFGNGEYVKYVLDGYDKLPEQ